MAVPVSQMYTVARYVITQRLRRRKHYPLVLMLEPLFRCNLSCAGCGKIQYPAHILKQHLSPQQCFDAVEQCGAPMVSIPGGEPLLHPQIQQIVEGLIERKKYIYVCTNAILLEKNLDKFTPSKYLTFSVHLDGLKDHHDFAVCREGTYDKAHAAIAAAVKRGFRVCTNTTLFEGVNPAEVRDFFDEMMSLGVEGMTISPGYSYDKAPDQDHFLKRAETNQLFETILSNRKSNWKFNQSPLFLEFLMGKRDYECTPWGNPTYNLFGWQRPCYLVQQGHEDSFDELIGKTDWSAWGRASGNPQCQDCMVHCGYEPSAVNHTFAGPSGILATIKAMLFYKYKNPAAAQRLEEAEKAKNQGVQLTVLNDPAA